MAASVVPIIYDHTSKKVLRWAVLDFDSQLSDPAFKPANINERMLRIPMQIYKMFGHSGVVVSNGAPVPALTDIQNYVNANAP